jgi:hypothetical protein
VFRFLWLREYRRRQIHQELLAILESNGYSEDSVQYWVSRFQLGKTICEYIRRIGRPLTDSAEPFLLILRNYSSASARMLSQHFNVCAATAKRSLLAILVWKNSLDDGYLINCHSKSHDGGKIQENSIGKVSCVVLIHLILLIWVHVTFYSLE